MCFPGKNVSQTTLSTNIEQGKKKDVYLRAVLETYNA